MKTNFESRFMQVATAGVSCQMSNDELNTEFSKFQNDVLGVLMSDRGYPAIDFMLRDLLAQLECAVCGKKNEHLWALIKRAKANLRTCIAQNEKRLSFPELFSPTIPPPRSPLHWTTNSTDAI